MSNNIDRNFINISYFNLNINNDSELQVRKETLTKKIQLLQSNKDLIKEVHENVILDIKLLGEKNLEKAEKELTFIYRIFIDELNKKYEILGQYISNSHISQLEKDNLFKELKQIPIFEDAMEHSQLETFTKKLNQVEKNFFAHLTTAFVPVRDLQKSYVENLLSDNKTFHISQQFIDFLDRLNAHITHPFKNPLLINDVQDEHDKLTLIYKEITRSKKENDIVPRNVAKRPETTSSMMTHFKQLLHTINKDNRITNREQLELLIAINTITQSEIISEDVPLLNAKYNAIKNDYLNKIKLNEQEVNDLRWNLSNLMDQLSKYDHSLAKSMFTLLNEFNERLKKVLTEEMTPFINGHAEEFYLVVKQKAENALEFLKNSVTLKKFQWLIDLISNDKTIDPSLVSELVQYLNKTVSFILSSKPPLTNERCETLYTKALEECYNKVPLLESEKTLILGKLKQLKNNVFNHCPPSSLRQELLDQIDEFERPFLSGAPLYAIKTLEYVEIKKTILSHLNNSFTAKSKTDECEQIPLSKEEIISELLDLNNKLTSANIKEEIRETLAAEISGVINTLVSSQLTDKEADNLYRIIQKNCLSQIHPLPQPEYDRIVEEIEILKNKVSEFGYAELTNKIALFEADLVSYPFSSKIDEWVALRDFCNDSFQKPVMQGMRQKLKLIREGIYSQYTTLQAQTLCELITALDEEIMEALDNKRTFEDIEKKYGKVMKMSTEALQRWSQIAPTTPKSEEPIPDLITLTQKLLNYKELIGCSELKEKPKQDLFQMINKAVSAFTSSTPPSASRAFSNYKIIEGCLKKIGLI